MRSTLNLIVFIAIAWQANLTGVANEEKNTQSKTTQIIQTDEKSFDEKYQKLKDFYKDEIVSSAFEESQTNLVELLTTPTSFEAGGCPFGPPPSWSVAYELTLEDMLHGNWQKAQEEITKAKVADSSYPAERPDLPNVILCGAIINKALGRSEMALNDLTELYDLHRQDPSLWRGSNTLFHMTVSDAVKNRLRRNSRQKTTK